MFMISVAVQKGKTVYVYNEKNMITMTTNGELHGYTGSSVTVKKDSMLYTYSEKGMLMSTRSAK